MAARGAFEACLHTVKEGDLRGAEQRYLDDNARDWRLSGLMGTASLIQVLRGMVDRDAYEYQHAEVTGDTARIGVRDGGTEFTVILYKDRRGWRIHDLYLGG